MSKKITPLTHGQGFTANLVTSLLVVFASRVGVPVSTTHVSCGALFGIGFGGTIPLNPAIRGEYFGRAAFGKIQGFMAPIMMMGSMVGPPLVGHLFDVQGTYRNGFLIVASLQVLAAVIIFFAKPPRYNAAERLEPA